MATLQLADGVLNYQIDGPAAAPVLVLSNSLGTTLGMWDEQIPQLSQSFRVVRYDTRGHGGSSVTDGPYRIEQLGRDVLALLDALKVERAAYCGLSMGGLIGQWLGINAPERFSHIVLCNTAAKIGNAEGWNARIATVTAGGAQAMAELRDGSIARWFTPQFSAANPVVAERIVSMLASTNPAGYAANCAAVRDADFREQLGQIQAKTLIICGTGDAVTTPEDGRFMQQRIAGAQQLDFHAAHLSNVEAGAAFTQALEHFLKA
ncbi:3-oxoadipate enol-lactonase [Pseudomonas sp. 5P_3.1_Bac2]|uniref:3-oxoadipate enol-lactonase n=1 Tax=Pseudomonas sp. 5P_3.1_Bac2 TaxID=2971617 RepID=UPI0021C5EA7F|nr:3-oxoadipate enol-lactonase [Pseudomonas sp. 5P_3.1_Bac2]MCU1717955.1 3-oxoadipate enol-lactonase [Pseudomonas sp. 5P_3.1_Bac2]